MSYKALVRNMRKASEQCSLKPGDHVVMVNCREADTHEGTIWTVSTHPWQLCGSTVVKLNGYAGGFDVTKLKLVDL